MVEIVKPHLEDLVGKTIMIYPRRLLNRGRLYTTQTWVDLTKLGCALEGFPDITLEPPCGWISEEKQGLVYTIGDGNHRIGLECIRRGEIPFLILGVWQPRERYGFNMIVNRIRSQLSTLNL